MCLFLAAADHSTAQHSPAKRSEHLRAQLVQERNGVRRLQRRDDALQLAQPLERLQCMVVVDRVVLRPACGLGMTQHLCPNPQMTG